MSDTCSVCGDRWEHSALAHEDFARDNERDDVVAYLLGRVPDSVITALREGWHRRPCDDTWQGKKCDLPIGHTGACTFMKAEP